MSKNVLDRTLDRRPGESEMMVFNIDLNTTEKVLDKSVRTLSTDFPDGSGGKSSSRLIVEAKCGAKMKFPPGLHG